MDTCLSREFIRLGIEKKYFSVSEDLKKITYHHLKRTEKFTDPEEVVRAEYYVELIEKYLYPINRIDFEVEIPRRKPCDFADIVIHEDDELKRPYIVIECKKDKISDAEFKQAIEQAFGNANSLRAKYAAVIAGETRTAFDIAGFDPAERYKNVIADIPESYGEAPEYKFIKGDAKKALKVIPKEELIQILEKTHDTVWEGGKRAPTAAFDEVSKLLFCKLSDETDSKITKRGEPYKFQIGTREKAKVVADRIFSIYKIAKDKDPDVFTDDIRLDENIIYSVVEHLQGINFNKTDLDTKGMAFERFMEDFFKGKMGQFFTPREIIHFCVKMMNPQTSDLVLDPACGSGGFLLNSMDFVRELAGKEYPDDNESDERFKMWHDFAKDNLYGIEINDQIARVCKMNMIIHDDGHSNVISADSLRDFKEIKDIHQNFKPNSFDLILTNPPFGAIVKQTEKKYLEDYKLGNKKKTQKTEILFLERCLGFLKPKIGRMAIVLPDGILTNSSLQYVRDFLLEQTQILAVVSLPQFAFSHYGAGVKSSLVFVRKKGKDERLGDYPIFMAIAEHIGYDATGRKDAQNNFDKICDEFIKFSKRPNTYEGY
jgi:type I restriction enzyme M protein